MAGRIFALTRPAVFQSKAAKICCRISQRIRAVSTRFMAQHLKQGAAVTRTSGDGPAIGCRDSQRLRCYADLPIPQSNSSYVS